MKKLLPVALGFLLAFSLSASLAFSAEEQHWGYSGAYSPENWHKADPSFAMCKEGKNQAPINIEPRYDVALPALELRYGRKGETVLNNGHTIQVPFSNGNSLTVAGGAVYSLQQVHFHTPSENTLAGRSFLLEAHFVHQDENGNMLVLAVFYKDGEKNPGLEPLWAAMPQAAGRTAKLTEKFDPMSILPASLDYIYFNGSLTTPPCWEGVRWCALKTPLTVSQDQAQALRNAMKGPNNRPVQPVNARPVLN
ncbi:MAG: carbonic anhydrase family protein [Deltaproteobacteria bacterium]|jgi:carbonic anhydrase|nr:carbonic anhydrase family protein [Deltaproteobacteria bacterium]